MEKTGREIENELIQASSITLIEPQEYTSEILEKSIQASYKTVKGDVIKIRFASKKREVYNEVAKIAFTKTIKDKYILLKDEHLIYLPPDIYWNIYKRQAFGKEFIQGTGYTMTINGDIYYFPDTSYYFSNQEVPLGERAIYAIYYQDILFYIGSTGTGVEQRWQEHHKCFKEQSSINLMYQRGYDPMEIHYKTLKTASELQEELGLPQSPSTWLLELVEKSYIEALQPLYNVEGKSKPFKFQAKEQRFIQEVPQNYWRMIKNWLEEGYKGDIPQYLQELNLESMMQSVEVGREEDS